MSSVKSGEFLNESSEAEVDVLSAGEVPENSGNMESDPLIVEPASSLDKRCHRNCCTLRSFLTWVRTNLLLLLTVASVLVGALIGISVREVDMPQESSGYRLMVVLLGFPGEIFLRMLKMLILPLIVFSLIAGLGSLETRVATSLGWKTVLYYATTTVLAVILGLILVSSIKPGGRSVVLDCDNSSDLGNDLKTLDSILDLIRNMLPDNLIEATFRHTETRYTVKNVTDFNKCLRLHNFTRDDVTFTVTSEFTNYSNHSGHISCTQVQQFIQEMNLSCKNATEYNRHIFGTGTRDGMNILGIIIFTVAFGIILSQLGPDGKRIVHAIGVLNDAIMRLVSLVMWYSPIGIASIIAGKLAEVEDFSVLFQEIGLYFVTVLLGVLLHGCVVLPTLYAIMTRKNPLKIIRAVLQALLTAFGTSSSSATLPITIQNLEDNFHMDPRVTRFMLPVGATINMDGTALYEAVAAVFIAQVEGMTLTIPKMIVISITATFASVGAAGVPQAGLFTLVIVLVAVGLNPENVALILTVDWLLDRFRTTVNVLGDTFGVGIVHHFTRKQLGPYPKPLLQASRENLDSSSSVTNENLHNVIAQSPDYGSSSPPPPTLPHLPSPQWSISSGNGLSDGLSDGSSRQDNFAQDSNRSHLRVSQGSLREETIL